MTPPQWRPSDQRFPLFQALIRSNPDLALSLAFADETIGSLRRAHPNVDPLLERRGTWEGEAFPMVEDSRDPRYSRIYLRLHSSEGALDINVGPGSGPIPPGSRRYRVEGVRAGEEVAAAKITVPLRVVFHDPGFVPAATIRIR